MKFMFRANVNKVDDFQFIARHSDCKPHNSTSYVPHPMWHTWKGGYRVRGHLSPMNCYQKTSYQKWKPSFRRMGAFNSTRRNSNRVLFGRRFRFRGYY